jgi:thymidylate kinase
MTLNTGREKSMPKSLLTLTWNRLLEIIQTRNPFTLDKETKMNNRPGIIEIVGLAGTGKSTLFRSLRLRNEEIKVFPLPKSWFIRSLTKRSNLWLPLWLQRHQLHKEFTREELISIGCIEAWLHYIQLQNSRSGDIAVLDPGSVYWLTKLQGYRSRLIGMSAYLRWWEDKFEQWSSALDVIIWLDAPEELCLQRVLGRQEWHHAKHMEANEVLERFRGLRKSYEQIILRMVSRHPKKVFCFRTDQISTEEIVDRIFSEVDLAPRGQTQSNSTDHSKDACDSPTQPSLNNSALRTGY